MSAQVDIYQCGVNHIHVVLRGQTEGEAVFCDFNEFTRFVKICEDFIKSRTSVPQVFQDAFDKKHDV